MGNDNVDTILGNARGLLVCFFLAAATAALLTFLHELAHYLVGAAFDFPGLTFEPTAVKDTAEAAGLPAWQRALKSVAGPLVNWSAAAVACIAARRQLTAQWVPVVGLVATIRGALQGGAYVIASALGRAPSGQGDDELHAAAALNLPALPVMIVTLGLAIGAWWFLVPRLAARRRLWTLALLVVGGVAGFVVYARVGALLMR